MAVTRLNCVLIFLTILFGGTSTSEQDASSCSDSNQYPNNPPCGAGAYNQCIFHEGNWVIVRQTCFNGGTWNDAYKSCLQGSCDDDRLTGQKSHAPPPPPLTPQPANVTSCSNYNQFPNNPICGSKSYNQCFFHEGAWMVKVLECPPGSSWDDVFKSCVEDNCDHNIDDLSGRTGPTRPPPSPQPSNPSPPEPLPPSPIPEIEDDNSSEEEDPDKIQNGGGTIFMSLGEWRDSYSPLKIS